MQTFLPNHSPLESLRVLDNKRLGKQRVEAYQILRALRGETRGWVNHPATKMWRGHEEALTYYMNEAISEWRRRGFRNTMERAHVNWNAFSWPGWIGDARLHASHRSNLLRKDPDFYGQYGWPEGPDLPYYWPV